MHAVNNNDNDDNYDDLTKKSNTFWFLALDTEGNVGHDNYFDLGWSDEKRFQSQDAIVGLLYNVFRAINV